MRSWIRRRGGARIVPVLAAMAVVLTGCVLSETGGAGVVANSSATLSGTIIGAPERTAIYWFEYGTSPSYGTSTEREAIGTHVSGQRPVSERVEGLLRDTTYHYRLCSVDDADQLGNCGADQTFTTGTDRELVLGSASSSTPPCSPRQGSAAAAGDAGGTGYVDGEVSISGSWPYGNPFNPCRYTSGGGAVECLRVDGNVAVVGFSYEGEISIGAVLLLIEDNGAVGDRFDLIPTGSITSCPAPDASLIGTGFIGSSLPVGSGDFVVVDD
jgi:hypothetical protein